MEKIRVKLDLESKADIEEEWTNSLHKVAF